MNDFLTRSASLLFIGMGWFPETPGGLNRYVYELTHHLANQQDDVELCGVGLPKGETVSDIKLTNLAASNSSLLKRLWHTRLNFLKREIVPLDAINLHFSLYSLPVLQHLPRNIPVTFTFHGPWALESQQEGASRIDVRLKQWMEQRVYNRCDRFIVLSKAFGSILHENYHIPWEKIHIIPGGVDTVRFQANLSREVARQQMNWDNEKFILFTPRRLVHRMGIDVLLDALVPIKDKFPKIWLAVAGKGPLRETLEQRAAELGLSENVKFLGYLPDEQLPIAYQAADLTVVPTQALEGFGLVVLESLACGTPVACTPIGGMPEILTGFAPELITETEHKESISELLEAVLNQTIVLPSRSACRDYAVKNFDWAKISKDVRQVLLSPKP